MDILLIIAQALWFIWPAYCANAFPPVVRGKRPVDFGRLLGGKRILGDGKTIEGSIAGIIFGIIIGLVMMEIYKLIPLQYGVYPFSLQILFLLSFGAIFGDMAGSFIKRRIGLKRGDPATLLDQLGFLIFAVAFAGTIHLIDIYSLIILLVLTPPIHIGANVFGFIIRLKKHPW
ncbi:CDP-2,3-bis-(O-geranylgeranyl)-sn-glycerol synthase [archaeon]|nr:CDP-2,3-bis-(O-geranylgeranyl)-sn-glycerol synthase [archaeon]